MAQRNRQGLSISRHRKSGKTTYSPKTRFHMALEAAKDQPKRTTNNCNADSVAELLERRHGQR